MRPTIVIARYGVGISEAVARRFGREGYRVAAVARNERRLADATQSLAAVGLDAKAYAADVSNLEAVHRVMNEIHTERGPVKVLHWNASAVVQAT